jgi:hypothetical protein
VLELAKGPSFVAAESCEPPASRLPASGSTTSSYQRDGTGRRIVAGEAGRRVGGWKLGHQPFGHRLLSPSGMRISVKRHGQSACSGAKHNTLAISSKKEPSRAVLTVEVAAASGASRRIALGCEELGGWALIGFAGRPIHDIVRFSCVSWHRWGSRSPLAVSPSHPSARQRRKKAPVARPSAFCHDGILGTRDEGPLLFHTSGSLQREPFLSRKGKQPGCARRCLGVRGAMRGVEEGKGEKSVLGIPIPIPCRAESPCFSEWSSRQEESDSAPARYRSPPRDLKTHAAGRKYSAVLRPGQPQQANNLTLNHST